MTERWRRPAEVLDIQQIHQAIWLPGGRMQGAVQLTLSADTIERMRTGYMCAKCLEPLRDPWPERCPLCGAPIRTEQAEYFAREFGGEVHMGPRTSWDDEIERMHEEVERERKEKT